MRIALLGTRGIPASYGGFETFAEELSVRLVERGHQVLVYCRQRHIEARYRGVDLVYAPTIRHKYLETLAHTFFSTLHLIFCRADVALYCNGANAIFTILPRLAGIPVALNVDGIERNRAKWNRYARAWYRMSERLSTILPNRFVSDAEVIRRYYLERYGKDSVFIPYGADMERAPTDDALHRLGLEAGCYFLFVSRMEPENHALEVRQAFEKVDTRFRLALIGDAPYADEYIRRVKDTRDPRITIPGAIYGKGYQELGSWCFAYIQATEVGGTHPALIEAMGRGCLILYLATPENVEVCGDSGLPYRDTEELTVRMREVLRMSAAEQAGLRERARARAMKLYSWDTVTDQYEALFRSLGSGVSHK